MTVLQTFNECNTLFCVKDKVKKNIKEWRSMPLNIVLADNSNNIGYMLVSSAPQRSNEYPYSGTFVQDGTTSKHDWEGVIPFKNLPFVINPKKGYFVNANNRIVPPRSKYDVGATSASTARSIRIDEMIRNKIDRGRKINMNDMRDIQEDTVDVYARESASTIASIARKMLPMLDKEDQKAIDLIDIM